MERSEDYKAWKAPLKQASVRNARLHNAWHTAGSLLVEQGVHTSEWFRRSSAMPG
jgi:hypothetical protein